MPLPPSNQLKSTEFLVTLDTTSLIERICQSYGPISWARKALRAARQRPIGPTQETQGVWDTRGRGGRGNSV